MKKKRKLMKELTQEFNRLIEYEIGETTAAATFYLAEMYAHFSKALMTSERPVLTFDYYRVKPGDTLSAIAKRNDSDVERIARENNLNKSNLIVAGKKLKIPRGLYPEELEQYELAIEEQAYPFEEKAIKVHEDNLKLIALGVYNDWVDKSLKKLAEVMPARYDKPEENSGIISSLETYIFAIERPEAAESDVANTEEHKTAEAGQTEENGPADEPVTAEVSQSEESEQGIEVKPETSSQDEQTDSETEKEAAVPEQAEEPDPGTGSVTGEHAQGDLTSLINTDQAPRR